MDYDAYQPDSVSRVKSGYAYRILGHDAATYYQYAIYVSYRVTRSSPAEDPNAAHTTRGTQDKNKAARTVE